MRFQAVRISVLRQSGVGRVDNVMKPIGGNREPPVARRSGTERASRSGSGATLRARLCSPNLARGSPKLIEPLRSRLMRATILARRHRQHGQRPWSSFGRVCWWRRTDGPSIGATHQRPSRIATRVRREVDIGRPCSYERRRSARSRRRPERPSASHWRQRSSKAPHTKLSQ